VSPGGAVKSRNFLTRLKDVQLHLLAPALGISPVIRHRFPIVTADGHRHRRLLQEAFQLRNEFKTLTAMRGSAPGDEDPRDPVSWQIMAVARGTVVGTARVRAYASSELPTAAELFAFGDIAIIDLDARRRVSEAYERFSRSHLESDGAFGLAGGLAVTPERQGSGLGPVLALAVSALFAHLGARSGCLASPYGKGPAQMYSRVGGTPLALDGDELPPFLCANHGHLGIIFALKALHYEPLWADTMKSLSAWVASTPVVLPHVLETIAC
jgi:GNAT superfamily N-acetyltransferase